MQDYDKAEIARLLRRIEERREIAIIELARMERAFKEYNAFIEKLEGILQSLEEE